MAPNNYATVNTDELSYEEWGELLDYWEMDAIYEPHSWPPKHVLALVRELKKTRKLLGEARDNLRALADEDADLKRLLDHKT